MGRLDDAEEHSRSKQVSCCRDLLLSMRFWSLACLVLGDGDPVDGHAARRSFESAAGVVDNLNREPCHRLAGDHKDRHRGVVAPPVNGLTKDRKSTRLNSSHLGISYA